MCGLYIELWIVRKTYFVQTNTCQKKKKKPYFKEILNETETLRRVGEDAVIKSVTGFMAYCYWQKRNKYAIKSVHIIS